jgi:hypothetical protein
MIDSNPDIEVLKGKMLDVIGAILDVKANVPMLADDHDKLNRYHENTAEFLAYLNEKKL